MRSYTRSLELFERAKRVTPGGAQTASKAPGRVGPLGAFPLYLDSAEGAYVKDVDGNLYVDWFNGNCAVTLGHNHPRVATRVNEALARYGALPSLPTLLETDVAEQLVAVIPCAEQIRFVKTGSEACAAAVRIARMVTGRHVILSPRGHYHGWHDWTIVRTPQHPGVPEALAGYLQEFDPLNVDSLRARLTDRVAAVMLEPPPNISARDRTWLHDVMRLARANGSLVILDEMITGGRWALGGAQEVFEVLPDLSTHGKAYANGFPIAFVAGRAELMRHAWPISGTFSGEVAGLAACAAVLQIYRSKPVLDHLCGAGAKLLYGLDAICRDLRLPTVMTGVVTRPILRWQLPPELRDLAVALFQQELAEHGVLTHPSGWNPSFAHGVEEIATTLEACRKALAIVAAALTSPKPEFFLRGTMLPPAFVRQEVTS
jgi:glutamate-1-semialdehyde 2,1-aminomutase